MTLTERIASIEAYRRTHDNVIRLDAPRERRTTPRWIEWTQVNERRGKDLSGYIGTGPDAA
jgi:hypothetical protein